MNTVQLLFYLQNKNHFAILHVSSRTDFCLVGSTSFISNSSRGCVCYHCSYCAYLWKGM